MSRGKLLELRYAKQPRKDFCTFIESTPQAEVIAFFRGVAMEIEQVRKILDFHMKIVDVEDDFRMNIFFGAEKSGPLMLPREGCISCYPNAPLFHFEGCSLKAQDCILDEYCDQPYAVCRLDAKGRSGFVVTPVRHVGRMSELNDEELFGLWNLSVRALRNSKLPFTSMILNHGTYRNLEHLHLKIWVDEKKYDEYRRAWSGTRQELWKQLQQLKIQNKALREEKKKKKQLDKLSSGV
jgi:diadenosine tetraphosphate (Ap4A) HIT family hydrolase